MHDNAENANVYKADWTHGLTDSRTRGLSGRDKSECADMHRQRRILSALTVQLGRAYYNSRRLRPAQYNRPPSLYRHALVYQRPLPTRTFVTQTSIDVLYYRDQYYTK